MKDVKDLYQSLLSANGFVLSEDGADNAGIQKYYLEPDKGEGYFQAYFYENMFEIVIRDFVFYEDFFLECPMPEFLSITYYTSVSGEEFHPYRQLSPNSLWASIGDGQHKKYQALYHKNVPIRSVEIEIMPVFYKQYLQQKFSGESIDLHEAFKQFAVKTEFPELVVLLKQIQYYSGSGLTAKMFYEGKVLEALALIIQKAKDNSVKKKSVLSKEDIENLQIVVAYIDNHYAFSIPLERLCRIAYMGGTKLKSSFREHYGCTITEYILQRRIEQSQHLLIETELSIGEIAKAIGYERADSFTKQFQKSTGILPRDYRNMIKPK